MESRVFKLNLQKGAKVNVWLKEGLAEGRGGNGTVVMEGRTNLFARSKKLVLELFLPRAHSNYALLGVDFSARGDGRSIIRWAIGCQGQERFREAMALLADTVVWGMPAEFQEGVMRSLDRHRRERLLPSGTITYNVSAHGEIGSSADVFRRTNDVLLSLLACDEMSEARIVRTVLEAFHDANPVGWGEDLGQ